MSNFNDKVLKSVAEAAAKIMAETSHGSTPKTPKEKSLAALAHPKDKITHKDVLVGRGVLKKEEKEELDEAFPTVADGEKSLKAKEGKTTHGKITKTKTGMKHERDYDDQPEPEVKRGRGRPKKRLSEMRQEYFNYFEEEVDNETFTKELEDQKAKFDGKKKGADVAKPSVQAVKQEEVEQIDELSKKTLGSYIKKANARQTDDYHDAGSMDVEPERRDGIARTEKINRAVDKLVSKKTNEEVEQIDELSHDTLRSYVDKAKKENLPGKGGNRGVALLTPGTRDKGVHKAVDKLKKMKANEEVEQIDEISADLAGKYLTAPQGKGANKYKVEPGKSKYPNAETMFKHTASVKRALQRSDTSSLNKKPSYYKEEVELDERTLTKGEAKKKEDYVMGMKKKMAGFKQRYGERAKSVMYATATKMAKKD